MDADGDSAEQIDTAERAEKLAQGLNSGARALPAVVVSISRSASSPWIDVGQLTADLKGLVTVHVLTSQEVSFAFSAAMPERTQVYGGAGRVYPVDLAWVHDPSRSHLRFAYAPAEGQRATALLIEDGLSAAAAAGLLSRTPSRTAREVSGTVKVIPTAWQAVVELTHSGYASIFAPRVVPDLPAEQLVSVGMPVHGLLDEERQQLDIRGMVPDPAARLAEVSDSDTFWARVERVDRKSCAIAPLPGITLDVALDTVTEDAGDDLRDLISVAEVVAVRARRDDAGLALELVDVDVDGPPAAALSILPGGPPWLVMPQPGPATDPDADAALGPDSDPDAGSGPRSVTETVPGRDDPASPPVEPTAVPAQAPPPDQEQERPAARPTPMDMMRGLRPPATTTPSAPKPAAPTPAGASAETLRRVQEQLADVNQRLSAERNNSAVLQQKIAGLEKSLTTARAELDQQDGEIEQQDRELASRTQQLENKELQLQKLRQQRRKSAQRELRQSHRPDQLFHDPERQFRHEVETQWARRFPGAEQGERPLRSYSLGPDFLLSLRETPGVDRAKVVDVVVEVLTGVADSMSGRDMHQLRTGKGGNDDRVRRDGSICWRVSLQQSSPQARRLHFWRSADDVELSRVVLHDDTTP